jgi:nucleoside-diphosphate-sugar epimerase
LPITIVRPFNIYGPGQKGEGAIANFIRASLRNAPLEVRNGGAQIRAWCYIDDFIEGVMLAASRQEGDGQIFNIGNPKGVESTLGLAKCILSLTGSNSPIENVYGGPEVEERIPDIAKATELLGFEPSIDLRAGLERTIAWYRSELS